MHYLLYVLSYQVYTDNSSPWADWRKCGKGQHYGGCKLNPGTVTSCDEERASRMRSCSRESIPLDGYCSGQEKACTNSQTKCCSKSIILLWCIRVIISLNMIMKRL